MNLVFTDQQFSYQLLRLMGNAAWGGSDIGECLSTAYRIKEGDFESWHAEWNQTAGRLHAWADECLRAGQTVSAGQAYLRAAHYRRAAEFYLHGSPSDPRIGEPSRQSQNCFSEALWLGGRPVEAAEIPYEGTALPTSSTARASNRQSGPHCWRRRASTGPLRSCTASRWRRPRAAGTA